MSQSFSLCCCAHSAHAMAETCDMIPRHRNTQHTMHTSTQCLHSVCNIKNFCYFSTFEMFEFKFYTIIW